MVLGIDGLISISPFIKPTIGSSYAAKRGAIEIDSTQWRDDFFIEI
jgi:hypothetical protein